MRYTVEDKIINSPPHGSEYTFILQCIFNTTEYQDVKNTRQVYAATKQPSKA